MIEEEEVPLAAPEVIEEEATPMAAPAENNAFWALLNLLLAIATAVLSVVLLLLYFKKDDDEENEYAEDQNKGSKGAARLLSLIPAIAGIITFILTENMSGKMQIVDKWTILMVVFLVINIILAAAAGQKKGGSDAQNEDF